ncbi:DUF4192 family protein [Streptomyces sp. NPDC006355]|uniref:DUF4192 domain-containing protein n=1 Tax=Streptomyces sp. NPDC006355 TaxID=3156758 RepID=UPI0033A6D4BD
MTNHSEATGSSENGDITGPEARGGHEKSGHARPGSDPAGPYALGPASDGHGGEHQVTLRTPAELADALPYLLGYRPEDSIVLVALHDRDGRGRFGGRARLGIPANPDDWPSAARQLAHGLVKGSERRGARPESMVAFLCQEPEKGQSGQQVMERLRPLAHRLRVECGSLDVVVVEALCISEGRYWSYCCDNAACCPRVGAPMGLPGTSVLAAAATYAGIQVRGTLRELRARLQPWENAAALQQEAALDTASMALVPRILDDAGRAEVADETLELVGKALDRFAEAQPVSGVLLADIRDDELLGHDEAARLILGLQDRATRDRAAEWMEGDEAARALRLWRTLARRCVGPYGEHAAAPLTLAGWVAWSTGDELEAREALAMALGADPDYLFARLLHQACNDGLDPESIRTCLRAEREGRGRAVTGGSEAGVDGTASGSGGSVTREDDTEARTTGSATRVPGTDTSPVGPEAQADGDQVARRGTALPELAPHSEPRTEPQSEPSPAAVPPRRRRRPRPAGASGGAPARARAAGPDPSTRPSHRRTPTGTARPAAAAEAQTRPGRATQAGSAGSKSARTGGTRARAARKAAMPCADTGREGGQSGRSAEGEE